MSFEPLRIDTRAYLFIRSQAIRNQLDAVVELVTNSVDAYKKRMVRDASEGLIEIEGEWEGSKMLNLTVRDHAIGMTAEDMSKCFLQVGIYTSTEESRGFFSRGAKDVAALGTVYFDSIKDGKYSRVVLLYDGTGALKHANKPVGQSMRDTLGIPKDGLRVRVVMNRSFQDMSKARFEEGVQYRYALRDILRDSTKKLMLKIESGGKTEVLKRLTFSYPPSTLVIESKFEVVGYPGIFAELKVYRTEIPMQRDLNLPGFLVRDDTSIFAHSFFNSLEIKSNPYIEYIHGTLTCPHIKTLMLEVDNKGFTPSNPYLIVDHSRTSGLVESHPFAVNLFKYPILRVIDYLYKVQDDQPTTSLRVEDLNTLLSKYDVLPTEKRLIRSGFETSERGNMIQAVEDSRAAHVLVEREFKYVASLASEEKTGDNPSFVYRRKADGEMLRLRIEDNGQEVSFDPQELFIQTDAPGFQIVFRHFKKEIRYEWVMHPHLLEIHINLDNKVLKQYFNPQSSDFKTLDKVDSVLILTEILIDAFAKIMTDKEIATNKTYYSQLSIDRYHEAFKTMFSKYQTLLEADIHSIMSKYIEKILGDKDSEIHKQFMAFEVALQDLLTGTGFDGIGRSLFNLESSIKTIENDILLADRPSLS